MGAEGDGRRWSAGDTVAMSVVNRRWKSLMDGGWERAVTDCHGLHGHGVHCHWSSRRASRWRTCVSPTRVNKARLSATSLKSDRSKSRACCARRATVARAAPQSTVKYSLATPTRAVVQSVQWTRETEVGADMIWGVNLWSNPVPKDRVSNPLGRNHRERNLTYDRGCYFL